MDFFEIMLQGALPQNEGWDYFWTIRFESLKIYGLQKGLEASIFMIYGHKTKL